MNENLFPPSPFFDTMQNLTKATQHDSHGEGTAEHRY